MLKKFFVIIATFVVSSVFSEELPTLLCIGKVSLNSEVGPLHPEDRHVFLVIPRHDQKVILLYRNNERDESLFEVCPSSNGLRQMG